MPDGYRHGAADVKLRKVEKLNDGHVLQIRVSEDVTDVWLFQHVGGLTAHGELQTDSRVTFVRLAAEQPIVWFILEGKLLIYEVIPLINSPVVTTFLSR